MTGEEAMPQSAASGPDRITALPDGVRERVLSFLSAHEAVRTTVLARSWRDFWRRSPVLRIAGWGSLAKFNRFVERSLSIHLSSPVSRRHPHGDPSAPSAPLDSCHFRFDIVDFEDRQVPDEALVKNWIQSALRCQVRVLEFCYSCDSWTGDPLPIPDLSLTASRHLTKLELVGVEVSDNLNLSGFPAMKDLKIESSWLYTKEIQSPYLKHLTMDDCSFLRHQRVRIHLPSLVSLKLTKCEGRIPFLAGMPSLETAIVTVAEEYCFDRCDLRSTDGCGDAHCDGCRDYYDSDTDRTSCLLLSALSESTSLELSAEPEVVVFIRDLKYAHTFGKLKTLVLADWFVTADLNALIWFLNHSPILEKLTLSISEVHKNTMTTEGSCKLPELVVASSHLKIVEIKWHEVDGILIEILKILTASGVPLEKINIQCSIARSACVNFKCTGFSTR